MKCCDTDLQCGPCSRLMSFRDIAFLTLHLLCLSMQHVPRKTDKMTEFCCSNGDCALTDPRSFTNKPARNGKYGCVPCGLSGNLTTVGEAVLSKMQPVVICVGNCPVDP